MSTVVHLIRHVPHEHQDVIQVGRMGDVEVAKGSEKRFKALAERFKREKIAAVYASPIHRAQLTAHAIADPAALTVHTREDLNELDAGEWTGQSFEALHQDPRYKPWNEARSLARCPGGESMLEVQSRMIRWLETARLDHPDEAIVAVSHGDPLKTILLLLLGLPLDAYGRIEVEPGSISTAVVGDWGAKVLKLNETVFE